MLSSRILALIQIGTFIATMVLFRHTSNANMADYSVGARDVSHESEASQVMIVLTMLSQKGLASSPIWSVFFRPPYAFLSY